MLINHLYFLFYFYKMASLLECNTCIVGITLLFASVYMSFIKHDDKHFVKFYDTLNEEQKLIYSVIVLERVMIYVTGMILGLILGIYYYFWYGHKHKYKLCSFLAIIYLTKLGFYYLYPKSPLMLYYLETKEQTDAWADVYTIMKSKWKHSLTVGFFGYLLLALSMRK